MFSSRGFSLIEAIVAILIGVTVVLGLGGLSERLIHHRTTADSNSAAMSLAERQLEKLFAISGAAKSPPAGCSVAQDLCGGAPPGGLTHGPTNIDINGTASAQGPYRVQWVVIDSSTAANSPLVLPPGITSKVKKITITVTHLRNPNVNASVVTYYKVS